MKKMIISVLITVFMLMSFSVSAFAHPDSFKSDSVSTASNLITVKKPSSSSTATMKTTYSITGTGKEGVSVCFYVYDGEKYVAQKNENSLPATLSIGASGVFYRQIALNDGLNRICVRAEADGECQLVYLSFNVIKETVTSDLDIFSINMQSKYNGWLN